MSTSATLSAASSVVREVPLRQDATVIGLVGLAHASSHFGHLLLPLLFPVFMKEFGLSFAELGFLMTVFFVVSGTGQATAGFVVDRIGARPALFGAFGFFIAACLVGANANGYASLMVVAVLAGLGNCTFHPVDFTILNQRVSAPRLGHAFSAHGLTGNLGWALAPVFFAGITALAGWRAAYLGAALMYALILVVLVFNRGQLRTEGRCPTCGRDACQRHGFHEAAGGLVVFRLFSAVHHDAGGGAEFFGVPSSRPCMG
jgi:FSR family fosmidomycin resistance protein-like MFS transporter